MQNLKAPVDGEMVYYTLNSKWITHGEVRPAMVVRVWSDVMVNLLVFLDGNNDRFIGADGWETVPGHVLWETSVTISNTGLGGTWHRADPVPELVEA